MKQYLLGAIALVTAITLNSFTLKPAGHPTSTKNYNYTAYPDDTHTADPSFYTLTPNNGNDPLHCPGNTHTCGVVAQDDGTGHPDFTQTFTIEQRN
jgi:hypothetical protein